MASDEQNTNKPVTVRELQPRSTTVLWSQMKEWRRSLSIMLSGRVV